MVFVMVMWYVVCFFKQKTAYEMRIMDCSSDLCSSDLIKTLSGNSQDSAFLHALNEAQAAYRTSQRSFSSLFFDAYRENNPGRKLAPLFANASTVDREIGRASCRERVCQYVWISVVGVSLQIKCKNNNSWIRVAK